MKIKYSYRCNINSIRKILAIIFTSLFILPLFHSISAEGIPENYKLITTFSGENGPTNVNLTFNNSENESTSVVLPNNMTAINSTLNLQIKEFEYEKSNNISNIQLSNGTFNNTYSYDGKISLNSFNKFTTQSKRNLYDIIFDSENENFFSSGIDGYLYAINNDKIYETQIENSTYIPSGDLQKSGEPAYFISWGPSYNLYNVSFKDGKWNISENAIIPYPQNYGGGPTTIGLMHNETKGMIVGAYKEYSWGLWHTMFQWYENNCVTTIQDLANDGSAHDIAWLDNNSYVFVGAKYYTGTLFIFKYEPSNISNQIPILELNGPQMGYPHIGIKPNSNYAIITGTISGRMGLTDPVGMYKYYLNNNSLELLRSDNIDWWSIKWAPDGTKALIAGSQGTVLFFNAADETFKQLFTGTNVTLRSIAWENNNTAYIVGDQGTILKYELNVTKGDYISPWIISESPFNAIKLNWQNQIGTGINAWIRFNDTDNWIMIQQNSKLNLNAFESRYQFKFDFIAYNNSWPILSNISISLSQISRIHSMAIFIGIAKLTHWDSFNSTNYWLPDFSSLLNEMIEYYKSNETNTTQIPITIQINGSGIIILSSLSILLTIKAPDLVVYNSDLTFSPKYPIYGDGITGTIKIYNSGTTKANSSKGQFYLNDGANNKIAISSILTIPALDVGSKYNLSSNLNLNGYHGHLNISFVVDIYNTIKEINENNNIATQILIINIPPIAIANPNQTIYPGYRAEFYDYESHDIDGEITKEIWYLGNKQIGFGNSTQYTFIQKGIYYVQLEVWDDMDAYNTTTTTVFVTIPPVAEAGADQYIKSGSWITLDGSGSYEPNGTIVKWSWDLKEFGNRTGRQISVFIPNPGIYTFRLIDVSTDILE